MKPARALVLLLAVSAVLRLALAWQGGQYFFGDEGRFLRGHALAEAAMRRDFSAARVVLAQPEHAAFTWLAALLAGPANLIAAATGIAPPRDAAALLLGLASVAIIFLVHRLARLGGADDREALWAAALAAASSTLFYYSRHLLPYDIALACWLGSVCLAYQRERRGLVAAGALATLTFHVYNGYWFLPPAALAWTLSLAANRTWRRFAAWAGGAAGGLLLPMAVGWIAGGAAYGQTLAAFAGTVKQGLFAEGWTLPWAYLWHSEGWLGVAVLAVIVAAVLRVRRPPPRVRRPLLAIGGLVVVLGVVSAGLEIFVLYARTVRPLLPLFCLAGGWAIARLLLPRPRLAPVIALLLAGATATQFAPHFGRMFPADLAAAVFREFGIVKRWVSFAGTRYEPFPPSERFRGDLALADAQYLYPLREWLGYPPGLVLAQFEHPLAWPGYQYEAHTPRERALLRAHPPRMRLIRLAAPATVPFHPPAAVLFSEEDRPDGRDHGRR